MELDNLGVILTRQGKLMEAEAVQREALDVWRTLSGTEHPDLARTLNNLGRVLLEEGKMTEAEVMIRDGLSIGRKLFGNEQPQMVSSLSTLAVLLLHERRFSEVDQLVRQDLIAASESDPKSLELVKWRGYLRVRRGQFAEAAADLALALKLNPADHELWHWLAPLLVQTGQIEGYREHCRKSAERFSATTYPLTAERIAKDCLLLPSSGVDLNTILQMTDNAIKADAGHWAMPWFQVVKALAEYRQERFASAAERIQRTPFLSEDRGWIRRTTYGEDEVDMFALPAYAVLAMAQFRLNQVTESRVALAKAWAIAEVKMPSLDRDSGDLGDSCVDWIIDNVLLNQAKALVSGQSASGIEWKAEVTRFYCRMVDRYRKAAQSGEPQALNKVAWRLATCPDAAVRDGPAAVAYAEKAVAATNRKNAAFLDTLAAGYAEVGDFAKAISVEKEATALAPDAWLMKQLAARLQSYELNAPYRER
jgi:tetratricopeptide (TPR) repeat protein